MNSAYRLTLLTTRLINLPSPSYARVQQYHRYFNPYLREMRNRKRRLGPEKPAHRSSFIDWNYDAELYSFAKRIREEFDPELLRRALTERSFVIKMEEDQKKVGIDASSERYDNTEMVEEGDKFINDFLQLYLRYSLPYFPEEGIQALRNHLTTEHMLSHISFHIGTPELILCADFPVQKSTLASVLKALVCALEESSGPDRTSLFVRDFIIAQLAQNNVNDFWTIEDPIAALKTICSNEGVNEPEPRLVGETGRNTILSCYRIGLYVDKQLIGLGPGETLKIAHEMAATDALRRLFRTADHQLLIPFDLVLDPSVESEPNPSLNEWSEKKVAERLQRVVPPLKQISHG